MKDLDPILPQRLQNPNFFRQIMLSVLLDTKYLSDLLIDLILCTQSSYIMQMCM